MRILLIVLLLSVAVVAQEQALPESVVQALPEGADADRVLQRLTTILSGEQMAHLQELNLRPEQAMQLMTLATEMAPQFSQGQMDLEGMYRSVKPRLHGILEPQQLDILQSLEPSAGQLVQLAAALQEFRGEWGAASQQFEGLQALLLRELQAFASDAERRQLLEALGSFLDDVRRLQPADSP